MILPTASNQIKSLLFRYCSINRIRETLLQVMLFRRRSNIFSTADKDITAQFYSELWCWKISFCSVLEQHQMPFKYSLKTRMISKYRVLDTNLFSLHLNFRHTIQSVHDSKAPTGHIGGCIPHKKIQAWYPFSWRAKSREMSHCIRSTGTGTCIISFPQQSPGCSCSGDRASPLLTWQNREHDTRQPEEMPLTAKINGRAEEVWAEKDCLDKHGFLNLVSLRDFQSG